MEQNENGVVKIVWRGGDRFDIHARRHVVRVDQLRDFGGGDSGPDPVELFVGSLAACAAHRAERYLHRCELPAGWLGFAPGFAYLTGLDPSLHVPRLATPRTSVPAGAVAIAGPYSAIYPSARF